MAPEDIRNAVLDILEDIAPDEDLSGLEDDRRFATSWNWTAWTFWTS